VQPLEATVLTLSTHASDGNNPPPAEHLDATLDFSVVDNSTLLLTVTNLTPEGPNDPALKIDQLYFNTSDDITALVLNEVNGSDITHWDLTFDSDNIHVNGFGLYDVSIIDGQGSEPHVIDPGETVEFIIGISGSGTFSDDDFIHLSMQIDHHIISYAAAKFYNGVPEMSAFGATNVPEPTTIALLGLGALALLRNRKKL
jgi:hypothetical protein